MDEIFIVDSHNMESQNYLCYQVLSQFQADLDNDNYNQSFKVLSKILSRILDTQDIITAFVEEEYVDKIYRDCYYNHYSGKHFEYSRYCKRVFLFKNDCSNYIGDYNEEVLCKNFIGCFVVKPLKVGAIGRTLLNPKYLFSISDQSKTYIRTTEYFVHLRGMKLKVRAFPFSMQDGETLTCAETSLLNIFDYYSNQYSDYRFLLPSDIFNAARTNGYERNLPSAGMSFMLMSRIMIEFGFYPRLYLKDAIINDEELIRILSYYTESAIPVALGIRGKDSFNHSVVCIGHGGNDTANMLRKLHRISINDSINSSNPSKPIFIADSANSIDKYIVMDDNISPYSTYNVTRTKKDVLSNDDIVLNNSQILCLAVPLYKRMCLEAKDARSICIELLKEDQFSINTPYFKLFDKKIGTEENPIVMRIFLASSRTFKRHRMLAFDENDFCRRLYSVTPFPQFVWVCELYDLEYYQNQRPIGEIVLDATSTATTIPFDSVIMMNYPGKYFAKLYNGKNMDIVDSIVDSSEQGIKCQNSEETNIFILDERLDNFTMFTKNLCKTSDL